MRIVIVGAGVAGLAIGWRLAEAGAAVEIVERGIAGRGASWAAAGMLAPYAEIIGAGNMDADIMRLARSARDSWPGFAAELEEASGEKIGYRETGSLIVAHDETRARTLRRAAGADGHAAWLGAEALREREPLVSPRVAGALWAPHDAQVDNRALAPALMAALARRSVPVREHCAAAAVATENGRAAGVATRDGIIAADAVVLATGAWMNLIEGVAPDSLPAVAPVKGQMIALLPPEGAALPRALIWDDGVYLVPRGDRIFAGATVEDVGFDLSLTKAAQSHLRAAAARLLPDSRSWACAEIWAGLRPRGMDDAPLLGATSVDGLYVAGGQFRNGILFAPAIAQALCALLLGSSMPGDAMRNLRAFDPRRASARTTP